VAQGVAIMRITKQQLRRIITEALGGASQGSTLLVAFPGANHGQVYSRVKKDVRGTTMVGNPSGSVLDVIKLGDILTVHSAQGLRDPWTNMWHVALGKRGANFLGALDVPVHESDLDRGDSVEVVSVGSKAIEIKKV